MTCAWFALSSEYPKSFVASTIAFWTRSEEKVAIAHVHVRTYTVLWKSRGFYMTKTNYSEFSNFIGPANIPAYGTKTLHILPDVFFPPPSPVFLRIREKYGWLVRLVPHNYATCICGLEPREEHVPRRLSGLYGYSWLPP